MPQTFDYMGALREGYTPKEIKRFVKGLDQQNDLEQRGSKFVQKQARQREAVNSLVDPSRSRASAGLTPAETLYPAGVTRDPIGQDIQNTAAAPNVPRPTGIVRAENVAPDLVSAFEQAPESSPGDATSGYLAEAPNVKLRGARGIVQGIKDAPKAAWLGLNQAASAGMQAIGDVVQEDVGILTKAAKATSDLLTLNLSPTEIPADTGSNVIQRVGRDAYAAHTQGMQELADKYAPGSWGGAVMNAVAQAGQQLGILGTAAAIGTRSPAAMTNFSLSALGAQSGLTEYGDARAKGFDVPHSMLKAGVGGGMEVATEVLPMGKLVNFMSAPAKKGVVAFLKDAAEYGLQDIGGELLNTMITDVVNNKMQARPNMTPQEQADEVSRYFSSGEWKQAAADTFKQAVIQGGVMMGAAKGVQHLDGKIRGEQDPLTDGVAFQPQNLPPVNPERQGRVDKLSGIMANESERTAQMRLNIANQRRNQQSAPTLPAQQVAPEAVQPAVPTVDPTQQQANPAPIAPTAEAPVAPVVAPEPTVTAPAQDEEAIAPELADLLRRKTNLEKAIFAADGTEKKTATKRMKDNYAAVTATIAALQQQKPEQEIAANGQQTEPETATAEPGAVAADGAGGAGGAAPADEAGMGSAEAVPGGEVSGVDEQPGDRVSLLRPQPDVAEAPQASPDIMALVDGKTDDQVQKTIDMVRGLNPERASQIETYWKSKTTPVSEPQAEQESTPAAQDGQESAPPAGEVAQKQPFDAATFSEERNKDHAEQVKAARKDAKERMEGLVKSIKNPETWEEFQNFITMNKDKGGVDALTSEQRKRYDELHAERNKEAAAKQIDRKAHVSEAGAQVDSEIIETTHTKTKEQSVVALRESTKEPFPRAAELAKKQQMLADLMRDMDQNPVPPPSWLRHGAPVGGEVFYQGKEFPVVGHKWDDTGYFVTIEKGGAAENIPYMEATDENGLPVYEEHEFEAPVVATATPGPSEDVNAAQSVTLDSMGLQQIYERLASTKLVKDAMADLKRLGQHVYAAGSTTWKPWFQGMKEALGKQLRRFRPVMESVWKTVNNERGSLSFRKDRTGDPRVDAVLDKIGSPDKTLADRIKDSLGNLAHKETRMREIEQGFFDRYASLRYLDKMAGVTGPDDSAYISARMTTSFSNVMYAMVHHGHPVWKDGGSAVQGKGLMDIFKPVADELDVFLGWMVGARAQKLMNEGRERYFDQDEINILKGLKTPENSARWEKVRRDYLQYKKQVLDFAEQSGVINPEARRIWDHEEYVPFYRVVEDKPKGPFKVKGLASQNSGIRTLKGADERLGDIFENIVQNFSHLVDASIKNRATELAVQKAEQIGAATPAPLEWKAVKIGNQQVVDAVHEFFGETQDDIDAFVNPEEMEAFTTFFHPAKPMGKDVIHVLRDGKPQYYQVHDDLLLRSMTSINERIWGGPAMTTMRFVKRLLTIGVTSDPTFMLRNFIRDTLHTWTISRGDFVPAISSLTGAVKAFREDDDMVQLMAAGGAFHGGFAYGNDPAAVKLMVRKLINKKGIDKSTILDTVKKVWEAYQEIGSALENAARVQTYANAKAKTGSHLQAAFEAKDVMDFSMRGDWAAINFLVQTVPFLGARIQGLQRLGKGMRENPVAFTLKGTAIALASTLLWLHNSMRPEYQELEEWDKDTYFHFFVGKKHFRLPKPFEVGAIFGTMPERLMELTLDKQHDGKLFFERMIAILTQTFAVGLPQILNEPVQQWANKDFFTGREIVGRDLQRLLPGEQSTPYTSATAKELGRAVHMSPRRLEHAVKGYFGELGMYCMGASDILVRKLWDYPAKPSTKPEDWPVLSAFYRGDGPARNTKYTTEFYDLLRETDQLTDTIQRFRETGEVPRADKLIEKNLPKLAVGGIPGQVQSELSKINKQMMRVHLDRSMSPDEKKAQLDELQGIKNKITRTVVEQAKEERNQ